MSRSGYVDDCEQWELIKYRGQVASAMRGRRGQAFLRELLAALDGMPDKVLISEDLVTEEGDACAIGVACQSRGLKIDPLGEYEPEDLGVMLGIARQLAAEIVYENDEGGPWGTSGETPAKRWTRMRRWVARRIMPTDAELIPIQEPGHEQA